MTKTKWTTTSDQITILPKSHYTLYGLIAFAAFLALGYFTKNELMGSTRTLISYIIVFGSVPAIYFALTRNTIIFNRITQLMTVKLFGIIPLKNIPFSNIAAIEPVYINGGAFEFKVFLKSNRHGKGISLTKQYGKESDENATAFIHEVIEPVEQWLGITAPAADTLVSAIPESQFSRPVVTSFENYKIDNGIYTISQQKIGGVVLAGLVIAGGVFYWVSQGANAGLFVPLFLIGLGLYLLSVVLKKVDLDTNTKMITVTTAGGLRKKDYAFHHFAGFSIVRNTTNFAHTGTVVSLQMSVGNSDKITLVPLKAFTQTNKIEDFLNETSTILGKETA
ncbi:hypothetical protein [Pedobacter cryoconitis]|uniref:Uncharacterized protein n=1 Tax=Pedobacter cryoconitis TaxID=188932 RepID=A0A7X0MIM0_9SPHI|nr:hypothetical protein [Pedobacter cryoconitis]MBB6500071.1 hypothetical protein [Pedobacter cryoconitis]